MERPGVLAGPAMAGGGVGGGGPLEALHNSRPPSLPPRGEVISLALCSLDPGQAGERKEHCVLSHNLLGLPDLGL